MDPSERLAIETALQQLFSEQPVACDLLISAFCAAAKSGRRATVCKPFPTKLVGVDAYDAAATALDSLSPAAIGSEYADMLHHTTDTQLQLLRWLLLLAQRTWLVSQAAPAEPLGELQDMQGSSSPSLRQVLFSQCCGVFSIGAACPQQQAPQQQSLDKGSRVLAYHGTDFANLHSILSQGLLAGSGTRLQTSGALFGQGIYLSTDFGTSFAFSKARPGWEGSSLGRHLRCMLVAEVASSDTQGGGVHEETVSMSGTPTSKDRLPEKYILVPRPSDVKLRYLLVMCDDGLLGHLPRNRSSSGGGSSTSSASMRVHAVNVCWALTCAYAGLMLLFAVWGRNGPRL